MPYVQLPPPGVLFLPTALLPRALNLSKDSFIGTYHWSSPQLHSTTFTKNLLSDKIMFTPSTIFLAKRIVRLASIILELILSHILRPTIDLSSNVASYISNGNVLFLCSTISFPISLASVLPKIAALYQQ
jgi:hypothetical protein